MTVTSPRPSTPIEDYALLGDGATCALVSRAGSIDWVCMPRFDSPACFAALLGGPEHGRWLLTPAAAATTTRRYLEDSLVLETTHVTATGTVRVTDLMPFGDDRIDILRRVEGVTGEVEMVHEWAVRAWYGSRAPWVTAQRDGETVVALTAVAGPDAFRLHGPVLSDGSPRTTFTVRAGEVVDLDMVWHPSYRAFSGTADVGAELERVLAESRAWLEPLTYRGPHADAVRRSVMVLHALSDEATGGVVAAPTTSLPEEIGGERNWDYRFCWLRDSALTLEAMIRCGYREPARAWRDWLLRAAAGDPRDIRIMYTVDGGTDLPERTLDHLPGYRGSRPVRIGNGAADQKQTDVLGEVMMALAAAREAGVAPDHDAWDLQRALVDDLVTHWDEPDNGIWEIRGPQRHFTHSRVMVWAALDRAIRTAEGCGLPGDVARWREVAEAVREEVLTRGWCEERQSFRQHYDTDEVDASLLVIPTTGFLPADDPRFVGTVAAVEQDLLRDGLVLRYRTSSGVDGLAGDEHPFLLCCFWLVSAYALSGRVDAASAMLDRLLALRNDVGLLAEESSPEGVFTGNFPQAFSHIGLINAVLDVEAARTGDTP